MAKTKKSIDEDDGAVSSKTFLPFCFVLPQSKFFPGLYDIPDTHAIPVATPPTNTLPPIQHATRATHVALLFENACVLFPCGN